MWLSRAGVLARRSQGWDASFAVTAVVMIAVFAYAFHRYLAKRFMDALLGSTSASS